MSRFLSVKNSELNSCMCRLDKDCCYFDRVLTSLRLCVRDFGGLVFGAQKQGGINF